MSRSGNEMVSELSRLLNKHEGGLGKTAEKKDEKEDKKDEKCEECGKDPCKCAEMKKEEKEKEKAKKEKEKEKADKKDKKKKKKAEVMMEVVNNLVKLAEDLDREGAKEAADLVDDALKVIIKNIKDTE